MSVVEAGRANARGKVTFRPPPPSGAPTPFAATKRASELNSPTPIGAGKQPPSAPTGGESEEQRGRRRASLKIRLKNNGEGERAEEGADGARRDAGVGQRQKKAWSADSNFRETVNSTETFRVRESVKTTRSTRDKEEEERRSSDYSRETVIFRGGDSEAVVTTKEDSSESASYSETTKPPRSILKKVSSYEHRAKPNRPPPATPPPPPPPPRPTAKSAATSSTSPSYPPPPPPPPLPPKSELQFREDFSRRAVREKEEREGGALPSPSAGRAPLGWQPRRPEQRQREQLRTGEAAPAPSPTKTTTAPDSVQFLGGGARGSRGGREGEGGGADGRGRGDSGQVS